MRRASVAAVPMQLRVTSHSPFVTPQVLMRLDKVLAEHHLDNSRLVQVRIYCTPLREGSAELLSTEAMAAVVQRWNRCIHGSYLFHTWLTHNPLNQLKHCMTT